MSMTDDIMRPVSVSPMMDCTAVRAPCFTVIARYRFLIILTAAWAVLAFTVSILRRLS